MYVWCAWQHYVKCPTPLFAIPCPWNEASHWTWCRLTSSKPQGPPVSVLQNVGLHSIRSYLLSRLPNPQYNPCEMSTVSLLLESTRALSFRFKPDVAALGLICCLLFHKARKSLFFFPLVSGKLYPNFSLKCNYIPLIIFVILKHLFFDNNTFSLSVLPHPLYDLFALMYLKSFRKSIGNHVLST